MFPAGFSVWQLPYTRTLVTPVRLSWTALVLVALSGVPAEAQIYAWRDAAGQMVLSDSPRDAIVVATLTEAIGMGAKAIVLGTAPSGGIIPDSWRPIISQTLENGLSLINGLHEPLAHNSPALK